MHDTLDYFQHDPIHRRYHHHELTFGLMYAFTENFILPLSHDEVVHGKGSLLREDARRPLAEAREPARAVRATCGRTRARSSCSWAASSPRSSEWSHERSLDWHLLERPEHAGVQALVRDLNRALPRRAGAVGARLRPDGFWWLEPNDADANVLAFARAVARRRARLLVFVANLSPVPREGYRLGLPRAGRWREALNTDSRSTAAATSATSAASRPSRSRGTASRSRRELTLPPLGGVWLVPE